MVHVIMKFHKWVKIPDDDDDATQKAFCRLRQGYFSALMEMFWTDNMNEGTEVTTSL